MDQDVPPMGLPGDRQQRDARVSAGPATVRKERPRGIGASARHEQRRLTNLADAARNLAAAEQEVARVREQRDLAVRAAVRAGIPRRDVQEAAGISGSTVSRIIHALR